MSISWPGTLPSAPLLDAFQAQPKLNLISFGTEVGPGKVRRRSTARVMVEQLAFNLTTAERDAFVTFFQTTLKDGALSFSLTDPLSGVSKSFRFEPNDPPYTIVPAGYGRWRVGFSLARLS